MATNSEVAWRVVNEHEIREWILSVWQYHDNRDILEMAIFEQEILEHAHRTLLDYFDKVLGFDVEGFTHQLNMGFILWEILFDTHLCHQKNCTIWAAQRRLHDEQSNGFRNLGVAPKQEECLYEGRLT